jgi:hypothetical protein
MKSVFSAQRVNFIGPATLVVGKLKIVGKAVMCGTLYVEVAASANFAAASSSTSFRPSDISGSFTAGEEGALAAVKKGEAEIVWKNQGKEATLALTVTEVHEASVKFVARNP